METEHTETVVEKAVAYVKDMFGLPPGDKTQSETGPSTEPLTPEARLGRIDDPNASTFKSVAEVYKESGQRPGVE